MLDAFYGPDREPITRGVRVCDWQRFSMFAHTSNGQCFLGLFGKNPPSPEAKAIPERRPAEATPDQGGFASRLTETGVAGTNRGDSGVLSGAQGTAWGAN